MRTLTPSPPPPPGLAQKLEAEYGRNAVRLAHSNHVQLVAGQLSICACDAIAGRIHGRQIPTLLSPDALALTRVLRELVDRGVLDVRLNDEQSAAHPVLKEIA